MSRLRVLVAEDNPQLRAMYGLAFQGDDLEVVTAHDGVEAQEIAKTMPPSVLMSDLDMPRCDGLGLVVALRAIMPMLPVLVVTGAADDDERVVALRGMGVEVLTKPTSLVWLRNHVRDLGSGSAPVSAPREVIELDGARQRAGLSLRHRSELWLAAFSSVIGCAMLVAMAATGHLSSITDPFSAQLFNRCLGIVSAAVMGGAYLHVRRQSRAGGLVLWAGALVWWVLVLALPGVEVLFLPVGLLAVMAALTALTPASLPRRQAGGAATAAA